MHSVGHLQHDDPFYGYLRRDILPQLGMNGGTPEFRVLRLPASNDVYLYEERCSGIRLVGKFFGGVVGRSADAAVRHLAAEHRHLRHVRGIGFAGFPHAVARPLGCNPGINRVLVEEFCEGRPLTDFILQAIRAGARDALFRKLAALAWFLATLHNRTAGGGRVDFEPECAYFDRIVARLADRGLVGAGEVRALAQGRDRWRVRGCMWDDCGVLVHGDATPSNFLLGEGPYVVAIDLERMKRSDRVFDLGRVAGELKHFFMQYAGDGCAAEPFIGHFLWEYACHFPDRDAAFRAITERNPFYMALTLLRIARNDWIAARHRGRLVREATRTLG